MDMMNCVAVGEKNRRDSTKIPTNSQNSAGEPAIDFSTLPTTTLGTAAKLALEELHRRGDEAFVAEILRREPNLAQMHPRGNSHVNTFV